MNHNDDDDDEDDYPEVEPVRRQQDLGDDPGIRMLLPVGRSGWAIAAGYLGLISVLCIPSPLALIAGILGKWTPKAGQPRGRDLSRIGACETAVREDLPCLDARQIGKRLSRRAWPWRPSRNGKPSAN